MGAHLDRMHVQEKEDEEMPGSFRKSFGKSWRFKRSDDSGAISGDLSDCHQSDSQRISVTASKLPCQAFGSAQSQVYPQVDVPSLNKCDLFSRSARQHGEIRRVPEERRRRMSDVGARTEKTGESSEAPRGLYKRLDRLSCSARHSEMDCSFSHSKFSEESRASTGDKLQKSDSNFKDSGNIEVPQKSNNAKEYYNRKSSASYSEGRFVENSCGKPGSKKSREKHLKSSKKLPSQSTDEAKSGAAALHKWFKHIVKRKKSQNVKNGQEEFHSDEQEPSEQMNAAFPNDVLEWGVLKDRDNNTKRYSFMGTFSVTSSNVPELIPHLQRSSSVPHSGSSKVYRNIHADMPRLSEASAGSLRRFSIMESKELEALDSEEALFPRRIHRESVHKRSSFSGKPKGLPVHNAAKTTENRTHLEADNIEHLNSFLRRQRIKLSDVPAEDGSERIKIILSGPDLTLSSMVAAICYSWMLEHTAIKDGGNPVPVINTTRQKMWEHRQAAWLFHHCGLDARALFFCDEVDLETLVHSRQLNIMVIGQDALKTDDEVASVCTILVEEYRQHAYDLLQHSYIRKLLLAGILVDTENLDPTAVFFTTRDRVVVDLLMSGGSQYNRYVLFGQLNQDHNESSLEEAMQCNYGEPSNDSELVGDEEDDMVCQKNDVDSNTNKTGLLQPGDESKLSSANPFDDFAYSHHDSSLTKSAVPSSSASGVKVKSTVAKWFGFRSRQPVKI